MSCHCYINEYTNKTVTCADCKDLIYFAHNSPIEDGMPQQPNAWSAPKKEEEKPNPAIQEDCNELKALRRLRLDYWKLKQKKSFREVTEAIIRKYGRGAL